MSSRQDDSYRLVYSSEQGEICSVCGLAKSKCACAERKQNEIKGNGNVKIRRETKGRGGKTVTTISGLALPQSKLQEMVTAFKKRCGTGGTVSDGVIEIQGDHRDTLLVELEKRGIKAKLAGG